MDVVAVVEGELDVVAVAGEDDAVEGLEFGLALGS